ncbi:MAG: GTPase Era [Dethiobacteria bacterium]|nr:GTPase Era [Bacillota bacterium]MDW7729168.1 GTPase Era [Bacillota bacterium]
MHRSGFVALVGRPNVGKSTLLNALVGEKVAITTDRPQTTRNQIRAVLTRPDFQIIFIDTPGLHRPRHKLGDSMVQVARAAMQEVDLVCFLVEASEAPGPGDRYIAEILQSVKSPKFLILNKIDLVSADKLSLRTETYGKLCDFQKHFLLSALTQKKFESLIKSICDLMPEGPQFYPPDMITDQPERFVASEIIREKVIMLTRQEIPFSIAVVIEEMKPRENGDILDIRAEIYVERKSQVGIIVGKGGLLLKDAGTKARRELEALFGQHIFLDIRVKVKKDWRNREEDLRRLGYHLR